MEEGGNSYDPESHTWTLGDTAAIPKTLRAYAESHDQEMPKGLYTFFGNTARYHLEREIEYISDSSKNGTGYDIRLNIALPRKGPANASRTLIWKHPDDIKAIYLGVGRTTKATNDTLRFYFGERHCLDRLTAEPWRINEFIQVLEMLHGPLRAVIFNAMTVSGSVVPIMRILDPTCVSDIEPLGVYTSMTDPNPPTIKLPNSQWKGWVPTANMRDADRKLLREFTSLPPSDLDARHAMIKERSGRLQRKGEIKDNPIMNRVIERRLENS